MQTGNLRSTTIYSQDEGDSVIPTNVDQEIHLQESYTGPAFVIPSSLANIPCSTFGVSGIQEKFDDLLGTGHSFGSIGKRGSSDLRSELLQRFINDNLDFGMAYARLRPWWHQDLNFALRDIARRESEDRDMRETSAYASLHDKNLFVTPPRRVWDLYANRVIPTWIAIDIAASFRLLGLEKTNIVGVSHSWMSEGLRHDVRTPINSFEWPVPIPIDTTLGRIRVELLNHGLEYVWLDVLCLRQAWNDPVSEEMRQKEWRLDVPTIGNVYQQGKKVVHYYSGLGRPFLVGDLKSDRHWLNRAWTLQEIHENSITAGITAGSPALDLIKINDGRKVIHADDQVQQFHEKLAKLADIARGANNIFPVLDAMRHRSSTKELDKICGMAYLLRSQRLPAYETEEPTEDAWWRFLDTINDIYRGELMFLYPERGNGKFTWGPSWQQVKDVKVLPDCKDLKLFERVYYDKSTGLYCHRGFRLDKCSLEGLAAESNEVGRQRKGSMILTDVTQIRHEFPVIAKHGIPIPQGNYTLIGSSQHKHWVVGISKEGDKVEKISALQLGDGKENWKLWTLGLGRVVESKFV